MDCGSSFTSLSANLYIGLSREHLFPFVWHNHDSLMFSLYLWIHCFIFVLNKASVFNGYVNVVACEVR